MARLDEIEKAVKAIAVYVKSETARLEKKMEEGGEPGEDFEALKEELKEIKLRMHEMKPSVNTDDLRELEAYVKKEVGRVESGISHEDMSRLRALIQEAEDRNRVLEAKLRGAEEAAQKLSAVDINRKVRDFDATLSRKLADIDAGVSRKLSAFDSDFESRVRKIEASDIGELHKRLDSMQEEIETGDVHNLARRLEILEDETKKLEEIRKLLEDERAFRTSLEKKVMDIDAKISNIHKEKPAALESEITPIIARRLEEFARAMDRKVPEIVTRDEFEKFSSDINNKMRYIEPPDTTPLQKRMDAVERKLDNLTNVLKDFLNRTPVIVE